MPSWSSRWRGGNHEDSLILVTPYSHQVLRMAIEYRASRGMFGGSNIFVYPDLRLTRRYSPLCRLTSGSCGGLRPKLFTLFVLFKAIFGVRY